MMGITTRLTPSQINEAVHKAKSAQNTADAIFSGSSTIVTNAIPYIPGSVIDYMVIVDLPTHGQYKVYFTYNCQGAQTTVHVKSGFLEWFELRLFIVNTNQVRIFCERHFNIPGTGSGSQFVPILLIQRVIK